MGRGGRLAKKNVSRSTKFEIREREREEDEASVKRREKTRERERGLWVAGRRRKASKVYRQSGG